MKLKYIPVIISLILFDAIPAQANAGVPMLALALPGMIISLIPIIIIETWCVRCSLQIPFHRALKAMTVANLESTLIGIPLTWVVWVIIEMAISFIGYHIGQSLNITLPAIVGAIFAVTVGAAWLGPVESDLYWMIPTAMILLLFPFFYVSWLLERSMARRFLKELSTEDVNRATFKANLYSYGILGIIVLGWLTISIITKANT